jgi:hypothetical protein
MMGQLASLSKPLSNRVMLKGYYTAIVLSVDRVKLSSFDHPEKAIA